MTKHERVIVASNSLEEVIKNLDGFVTILEHGDSPRPENGDSVDKKGVSLSMSDFLDSQSGILDGYSDYLISIRERLVRCLLEDTTQESPGIRKQ
jgi:hypothetical protein